LPPSPPPLQPHPRSAAGLGAVAPLAFLSTGSARQEKKKENKRRSRITVESGEMERHKMIGIFPK
jgi:hypothetical protein